MELRNAKVGWNTSTQTAFVSCCSRGLCSVLGFSLCEGFGSLLADFGTFATFISSVMDWNDADLYRSAIIPLTVFLPFTSSLGAIAKKTKLCGDEACSEKLFEGRFHRSSLANHESFLSPNENDIVSVYAIKFSDRTDLMEGALLREPSRKGNFFSMHINLDSYVEFLKSAVVSNKTMFMISRDPDEHPSHRLVGVKAALPELIKDYEVNAKRLANERQLPPPEQIDYAALGYVPDGTGDRGHSHGFGHRHSHDHDHSHGHEHIHSHGNSHEYVFSEQKTRHSPEPVVLELGIPTSGPQEIPTETVTSVHHQQQQHQQVPVAASETKTPIKHNAISDPVSVSIPDPGLASVIPESAVSGFPPPESLPSVDTSQPELSQGKAPADTNTIDSQKFPPIESPEPISVQQVNVQLSPPQVLTTAASVGGLEADLPSTLTETLEVDLSLSPVNVSLSNASYKGNVTPLNPSHSSTASLPDEVPPPIDTTDSAFLHASSAPLSVPPTKDPSTKPEAQAANANAAVLTGNNVLPITPIPHTEPAAIHLPAQTEIELKRGSEEKVETTVGIQSESHLVLPELPSNSIFPPATNPPVAEGISPIKEEARWNPLADKGTGNADGAVQGSEVKTNIVEEDGLGYCIKGVCDKVYETHVINEKQNTEYLFLIGRWLSKLISIARYLLPSAISNIDDAGVLVTLFVPICLVIHLLRILVFADACDKVNFDRRTLHNALTVIRQREIQIKLMQAEIENGKKTWNAEMDEKFRSLQSEMVQFKAKCHVLEEENDSLKAETDETSQMVERERLKCRDLTEQNKNLVEKNELLTKQISGIHDTVGLLREENERLTSEVTQKSAQLIRLESEGNSHSLEIKNLKDQLKTSLAESKMLHERVKELQNETVQLSEIINEMHYSDNGVASDQPAVTQAGNGEEGQKDMNGGNGWSDFDEFEIENPTAPEVRERSNRERGSVPRFSSADIMEVAKLRVQLRTVETDLDQAKLTLQKQLNERDHLIRKVELAEAEAMKRLKEVEAKEAERVEAHNQFKRILGMVEEREAKLRSAEELTDKLRNEAMKWQEEVRQLEGQKKAVEFKLMEADQELKRLKAEYAKLETRNFHEIRQYKQTIAALQQQSAEQAHLSNPSSNIPDNASVLNISASSSLDRDYSVGTGLAALRLPHVRPLWDDDPSEIFSSRGESSLLKKTDPLLNDITLENGNINYKRGSKPRRSIRERDHNVGMDGTQSRYKKESRRMRSRSHGRHPGHTDYYPMLGMPGANLDFSNRTILNKQNSKSGTVYYSSGGSNDGRSPPPEMALLSGVPPPGPMIKKPTPRPKSSTEPLERR
uniref:Uncharacterized protein n=1 Tax=Setaria digitata TaxID=48799 RepID=A0A915PLT5_9BILA